MKTTDLRINNYVKLVFPDGEITCIVEGIKWDSIALNIDGRIGWYDSTNIEPILLTEEILLEYGFLKCEGKYGEYYKHGVFTGFRVWLDDYSWYIVGRKDYKTDDTYWVKPDIQYLHQLQNLYFALTQEELILKERTL